MLSSSTHTTAHQSESAESFATGQSTCMEWNSLLTGKLSATNRALPCKFRFVSPSGFGSACPILRILSEAKILAMVNAYLDESGIHDGAAICVISGYFGGPGRGKKFEKLCRKTLDDARLPMESVWYRLTDEIRVSPRSLRRTDNVSFLCE